MYVYIMYHVITSRNEVKINVATDEENSRNEI